MRSNSYTLLGISLSPTGKMRSISTCLSSAVIFDLVYLVIFQSKMMMPAIPGRRCKETAVTPCQIGLFWVKTGEMAQSRVDPRWAEMTRCGVAPGHFVSARPISSGLSGTEFYPTWHGILIIYPFSETRKDLCWLEMIRNGSGATKASGQFGLFRVNSAHFGSDRVRFAVTANSSTFKITTYFPMGVLKP